jgi:aquaporin Z
MKYVYEFIGTFFLVTVVGMVIIEPGATVPGFAPLAIGTVLAVMIFAGGHVSGGHYNPAVSLAVFIRGARTESCERAFTGGSLIAYWIVQLVAGFIAALLVIYLKSSYATATTATVVVPTVNVAAYMIAALIVEFLGTFALTYTVLNVATAKGTSGNSFYGWAIGMAVLAGAYAFGTITGGAFNPAVALGITQMGVTPWASIWIYWVPQLVAGIVAAFVFRAAHPGE